MSFFFLKIVSFELCVISFVQGQSSLCQLGTEALPTQACSEDSSVSAVAHRYICKRVIFTFIHIQFNFLMHYL